MYLAHLRRMPPALPTSTCKTQCDKPQPYIIVSTGSTLRTQLSPRASKSTKLNHGDSIKVGSNVIHKVSTASDGKTVLVCNK